VLRAGLMIGLSETTAQVPWLLHIFTSVDSFFSELTVRGKSLLGKPLVRYSASSLTLTNQKVHYTNTRVRKWIRHEPDESCALSPLTCYRNAYNMLVKM